MCLPTKRKPKISVANRIDLKWRAAGFASRPSYLMCMHGTNSDIEANGIIDAVMQLVDRKG